MARPPWKWQIHAEMNDQGIKANRKQPEIQRTHASASLDNFEKQEIQIRGTMHMRQSIRWSRSGVKSQVGSIRSTKTSIRLVLRVRIHVELILRPSEQRE